ncbi:hypothetical protein BHE74_00004834 [Ensete ventricosum]|nr:hypothetical protein GW17_00051274 [Ensete ventricosum]RWW86397.1 hypothetical protein BHE74_00004834 [Ensete ventricosum]
MYNCMKTSTCWKKGRPRHISENSYIRRMSQDSTIVEYALDKLPRATLSCTKPR